MMAKVLIVEDETALREAYELVLKKAGYDTLGAVNGLEALKAFETADFDVVLLDLRMPKMDGVEFLKKLKPAKSHPNTKIIIFSNYDDQGEVSEAMKSGADRYILKAWSSPGELVKVVEQTLEES
jgi:CheY-like chemotaxis protein